MLIGFAFCTFVKNINNKFKLCNVTLHFAQDNTVPWQAKTHIIDVILQEEFEVDHNFDGVFVSSCRLDHIRNSESTRCLRSKMNILINLMLYIQIELHLL